MLIWLVRGNAGYSSEDSAHSQHLPEGETTTSILGTVDRVDNTCFAGSGNALYWPVLLDIRCKNQISFHSVVYRLFDIENGSAVLTMPFWS